MKTWDKARWREEALQTKTTLKDRQSALANTRSQLDKERSRANTYREILKQLLRDAGEFPNLSSKYVASKIGELI